MKEIVKIFKNIDVLNLIISESGKKDDYLYCIEIFKAWCKFLDYPFDELSFYCFIQEIATLKIHKDTIRMKLNNKIDFNFTLLEYKNKIWYDFGLSTCINNTNYLELFKVEKRR